MIKEQKLTIIDPVEEARALAFHLGREQNAKRAPLAAPKECAEELRTVEMEYIMSEVPA